VATTKLGLPFFIALRNTHELRVFQLGPDTAHIKRSQ